MSFRNQNQVLKYYFLSHFSFYFQKYKHYYDLLLVSMFSLQIQPYWIGIAILKSYLSFKNKKVNIFFTLRKIRQNDLGISG